MEAAIGEGWKEHFDLCLTNCKKPLFYQGKTPFYEMTSGTRSETKLTKENQFFMEGNA
jgi:hypothetical protein